MGWLLLLSPTGCEIGLQRASSHCMVDGQLAFQTAMNDVEALLGRLISRYGDEAVWQLSTPSSQLGSQVPMWNMHCPHSSSLAYAARECTSPQSRGFLPVPRRQLELDLYISIAVKLADMSTVIARLCGEGSELPLAVSCFLYHTWFLATVSKGENAVCRLLQSVSTRKMQQP